MQDRDIFIYFLFLFFFLTFIYLFFSESRMTEIESNHSKVDEITPLLPRQRQGSWENDAKKSAKKPSVWYVIAPLFGLTLCFG